MNDLIGTCIGKYRLERLIGEGGMGSVYEARHTMVGKRCALKLLHADLAQNEQVVHRMLRESQAAAAIGHPNIVETHDFGASDEGGTYLVMDLLEGQDLGDRMDQQGPMAIDLLVTILVQVLSALEAAHRAGIVHRDIKPDNVFLARTRRGGEEVKLLDFGVSKFSGGSDDLRLTQTGAVLGTPFYMSPEQASGDKNIDGRTDLWAVAAILYQGLTGRVPFAGDNYNRLMFNILTQEPPSVRAERPDVPAALEAVITRAMQKEPDQRFGDATEMLAALEPFGAPLTPIGELSSPKPVPMPPVVIITEPAAPVAPVASAVAASDPLSGGSVTMSPAEVMGPVNVAQGAPGRRRALVIGGIASGAVLLIGVLVLARGRGSEPNAGNGSKGLSRGAMGDTGEADAMEGPVVKTLSLPMRAAAKLLSVTVTGLPDGARLRLDGVLLTGATLRLPADGKEHRLDVDARGYRPERTLFVARPGLESLVVRMTRRSVRRSRRRVTRRVTPRVTRRVTPRPMRRVTPHPTPRVTPRPMRVRPRTTSGGVFGDPYR